MEEVASETVRVGGSGFSEMGVGASVVLSFGGMDFSEMEW